MDEEIPIANFILGEKFKTWDAFETKLKQYQDTNFIQLYKRSSKKIDTSIAKFANCEQKYCELLYTCIHG